MNSDIRLSITFKNHIKRKKLRRLLGDRSDGYLIDFWISVATHRPEGVLTGWDAGDIADMCDYSGNANELVSAFLKVGLLNIDSNEVYTVYNWEKHQGWACGANKRSEAASKAAKARWLKREKTKNKGIITDAVAMLAHTKTDAAALPPHTKTDAVALPPHTKSTKKPIDLNDHRSAKNADALPPHVKTDAVALLPHVNNDAGAMRPQCAPQCPFPSLSLNTYISDFQEKNGKQEKTDFFQKSDIDISPVKKQKQQKISFWHSRNGEKLVRETAEGKQFEEFWDKFGNKQDRQDCIFEFLKLLRSPEWTEDLYKKILAGADMSKKLNKTYDKTHQLKPLPFLMKRRWENETDSDSEEPGTKPEEKKEQRRIDISDSEYDILEKLSVECNKNDRGCRGFVNSKGNKINMDDETLPCAACDVMDDPGHKRRRGFVFIREF